MAPHTYSTVLSINATYTVIQCSQSEPLIQLCSLANYGHSYSAVNSGTSYSYIVWSIRATHTIREDVLMNEGVTAQVVITVQIVGAQGIRPTATFAQPYQFSEPGAKKHGPVIG